MSVLQTGLQRPTLCHEPPDAVDWTLSDIALDWCREVAGYDLDDWQAWLLRWTFVRRPDRLWAARDVGAEVSRQNGKNVWLEALELVSVFEFGDNLITHSAHRADVSHEHFLALKERIQERDDLMRLMPTGRSNDGFSTSHGLESIEMANGHRILFKARANSSGRGPRPKKIIFDEALILQAGQVGSMAPGISAQRNPQIIFASSPPKTESAVLHSLRKRADEAEAGDRLFYAAWNNPQGTDVADRDAWYRANPSLGYGRMTEDSLMANRKLMDEAEFMREHIGIPEDPPDESTESLVPGWDDLVDPASKIASHRALALDVSPDRRWAALGWAGRRDDGLLHVEAFDHRPGTSWLTAACVALKAKWDLPIRIQNGSPAASWIDLLREADVDVVEVSPTEHATALGQFLDAVRNETVRHIGAAALTKAAKNGVLRSAGDVDLWARRSSRVDITPLVAVTLALGGVPAPDRKVDSWAFAG